MYNLLFSRLIRLVLAGILLLIVISAIHGILRLSSSGSRIGEAEEKLVEVKREQEELKKELERVQSNHYAEQQTRDKLGMAKEGEIVIVLPEEEMLRRLSPRRAENEILTTSDSNWKKWAKLFFEI